MNQKTQRFATIRKIIRSEMVSSQEELIKRLRECGVEITQSTLSRDLKFMNVAKVPHKTRGYVYVLPNSALGKGLLLTLEHMFTPHHLYFLICSFAVNAQDPKYRCFFSVLEEDLQESFKEVENGIYSCPEMVVE